MGGLEFFDEPFRYRDGTDVAVDGIRTDRQYAHITHDVVLPDADIRASRADVDDCGAEFLFVFGQYRGCARLRVGEEPALDDAEPQESLVEPFKASPVGEDEVESGFELLSEAAHGLHCLFARVDDILLRRPVEDADAFGRLEAVHAFVELGDILFADFVVFAADVDEVGAVGALDIVAGDARIGFRHLDAEMFLQFAYGGTDCARHLFDIDNLTARHALHGFGDHVDDVESAVGVLAAGCRRHAARTEVDGHYVVLVFRLHVIFPFAKKRPCRCSPVIIPAAQGGLPFAAYHLAVVFEVDVVPFVPALFRHGLSVKGQQFIEFPFVTV